MTGPRMSTPPASATRLGSTSSRATEPSTTHVVCISTDVYASAALQAAVSVILPDARVEAADTSIVRSVPEADGVIVAVGRLYSVGASLVRELRARGFERSIILVVESPAGADPRELSRLGVTAILAEADLALQLPAALRGLFAEDGRMRGSVHGNAMATSLRHLQATIAAGEMARGLQHQLNNPLAALLAEAQLLEIESLPTEHHAAVGRIIELCRRVIDVSRSIDGMGGKADGDALLRPLGSGGL